jgi:hypothetical protein
VAKVRASFTTAPASSSSEKISETVRSAADAVTGSIDHDGTVLARDLERSAAAIRVAASFLEQAQNTTIGVVITNARLDKLGCLAAAQGAHDGLARAIGGLTGELFILQARPETVQSLAEGVGLGADENNIAFCNTGHWASIAWFGLSEVLGNKNTRMYDGSMAEWAADPDRPVENRSVN